MNRLYALAPVGIELGLGRLREVAARLGDPQNQFLSIQVAGTNGKGTVCALLSQAITEAALTVGLFTSPHLHRFAERIRIQFEPSEDTLIEHHLNQVFDAMDTPHFIPLTFFEVATLAALSIFAKKRVDIAILEVGLGGRLDATSIASPILSAVTSIGFDHQAFLGHTLAQIAKEKAAIARAQTPLVVGRLEKSALAATRLEAQHRGAHIEILGEDFELSPHLQPPWPGAHQRDNTAIAQHLFRHLSTRFPTCTDSAFETALDHAQWPGRFERIDGKLTYILDCAHNVAAVTTLVQTLQETSTTPHTLIFGSLKDKPAIEMLTALRPLVKQVVLAPPPIPRALNPRVIAASEDQIQDTVAGAMDAAEQLTPKGEIILVAGSIFMVAAVRGRLLNEPADPPVGL